ncbi:MAG: SDR family NAD(P)-dependent oxidoreductase [Myxococcota bacterium]|nr:SDR family NAD(P)-dependent oxidoreductase [Myxococcota bacterium]
MTARTALVTGVTAGFGLAIARQLHGLGWRIIGTGRRQERLVSLGQELGDGFDWLCFDVQDRQACVDAVEELKRRHGVPDLLVNNAGLARGLEPAYQCDLDDWEQMVETNIKGLITLTRLISPDMVARKAGTIINISSIAANYAYPGANVYGATKAFVSQFSLNLRADLHGSGVRVTSIEPGLAQTEFSVVRFGGDLERARAAYANTDYLTGEDVAEAVCWVAEQPGHVNINRLELMPVSQSFGPFPIHRSGSDEAS